MDDREFKGIIIVMGMQSYNEAWTSTEEGAYTNAEGIYIIGMLHMMIEVYALRAGMSL